MIYSTRHERVNYSWPQFNFADIQVDGNDKTAPSHNSHTATSTGQVTTLHDITRVRIPCYIAMYYLMW